MDNKIQINDFPEKLKSSLIDNKTSLGNNPSIPDIYDMPFLLKISYDRFEHLTEKLSNAFNIGELSIEDIDNLLNKLIVKCKEIERPYRDKLEKLCLNYVIDLFNVPKDTVQIELSLVDKVIFSDFQIPIDKSSEDEFEFDSVKDISNIKRELFKRKTLNALCAGGAITMSSNVNSYSEDIDEISPDLCGLYRMIILLNNYSLYLHEDIDITDENPKQIGCVNVILNDEDEMVKIKAQAEIFPILLSETIKGFMELFVSHGLPETKEVASYVIKNTDYLKSEPWNMRIGPSLWKLFSKSMNDLTPQELPYLLQKVSMLDVDDFNYLMKEVFAKTKKGKALMSRLCNNAKQDIDYDKFVDKMDKLKTDNSLIIDEFINENEL